MEENGGCAIRAEVRLNSSLVLSWRTPHFPTFFFDLQGKKSSFLGKSEILIMTSLWTCSKNSKPGERFGQRFRILFYLFGDHPWRR